MEISHYFSVEPLLSQDILNDFLLYEIEVCLLCFDMCRAVMWIYCCPDPGSQELSRRVQSTGPFYFLIPDAITEPVIPPLLTGQCI